MEKDTLHASAGLVQSSPKLVVVGLLLLLAAILGWGVEPKKGANAYGFPAKSNTSF